MLPRIALCMHFCSRSRLDPLIQISEVQLYQALEDKQDCHAFNPEICAVECACQSVSISLIPDRKDLQSKVGSREHAKPKKILCAPFLSRTFPRRRNGGSDAKIYQQQSEFRIKFEINYYNSREASQKGREQTFLACLENDKLFLKRERERGSQFNSIDFLFKTHRQTWTAFAKMSLIF